MRVHNKVAGYYKLEAIKMKDGKEVSRRIAADWFPNLITNQGLDHLASNQSVTYFSDVGEWSVPLLNNCSVGTGNTTPANTDTSLDTFLVNTTSKTAYASDVVTSGTPYYASWEVTYRFGTGTAAGNLTEVCVGWASNTPFSRALILDGVGSPTTITILSDEVLDVSYELRLYPKETDTTGTVVLTGNIGGSYSWTMRSADLDIDYPQDTGAFAPWGFTKTAYTNSNIWKAIAYDGAIGTILTRPAGSTSNGSVLSFATYSSGTYEVTGTITFSITQGNLGSGIKCIAFPCGCRCYQVQFGTAIPKTSSDVLTLTFTLSWGRL